MQATPGKAQHTYQKSRKKKKMYSASLERKCAGKCSFLEFVQVWDLALMPQHSLSDLQAEGFPQWRRHCVSYLAVLVPDGARESEVIPKALASCILPHTEKPVLLRV